MLAKDIAAKLSATLPLYTNAFSDSVNVVSITTVGSVATVTTDVVHNIVDDQYVAVLNALAPVQVDTAAFLKVGSVVTLETLQDHDLTLSERDKVKGKMITIANANEAEYNASFVLLRVINRRKIQIAVDDSYSATISGSPVITNANLNIFNGWVKAYNTTVTTFDYDLPLAFNLDAYVADATIQAYTRVLRVLNINQYLQDVYTRKLINDDVIAVQLGDVSLSKDRDEQSDASSSNSGQFKFNPLLIQTFAVYIIQNVTNSLTAAEARDKVEEEYIPAIFKSLLLHSFKSQFSYTTHRCTFVNHGVYAYSEPAAQGKALYVHEVNFEQLIQITKNDASDQSLSRAMRDIDITITSAVGNELEKLEANINLDEEPL